MSERDPDRRGQGNVAGAMRRRVGGAGSGRGSERGAGAVPGPGKRRRARAKVGKRSDPNYMMAGGYVREDVHEKVMETLGNRVVRRMLVEELEEYGVKHDSKRVYYGDLAELLCLQWLERIGVEIEER